MEFLQTYIKNECSHRSTQRASKCLSQASDTVVPPQDLADKKTITDSLSYWIFRKLAPISFCSSQVPFFCCLIKVMNNTWPSLSLFLGVGTLPFWLLSFTGSAIFFWVFRVVQSKFCGTRKFNEILKKFNHQRNEAHVVLNIPTNSDTHQLGKLALRNVEPNYVSSLPKCQATEEELINWQKLVNIKAKYNKVQCRISGVLGKQWKLDFGGKTKFKQVI